MTQSSVSRLSITIGLAGAVLGVLMTLVGVSLAFGGYREKIEANTKKMDTLESNVNQRLIRIEDKVDQLTNTVLTNANAKRK